MFIYTYLILEIKNIIIETVHSYVKIFLKCSKQKTERLKIS